MKFLKSLIAAGGILTIMQFVNAQEYIQNKNYADNWVATDALGRKLPVYGEVGPLRNDREVGVFYYIWHGYHGNRVLDITKILKEYPKEPLSKKNPGWGKTGEFHFWGEPEAGYYRAEDPWVIRRNLNMLAAAKTDFIFFDVTNAVTYLEAVKALCDVSAEMRNQGIPTPAIAFITNSNSGTTMNSLYDEFYAQNEHKDLWYFWEGKPLLFGDINDPKLRSEVKNFFTIRKSWVGEQYQVALENHWPWLAWYPQGWGWSGEPSNREQVSVSVAFHPQNPHGKSCTDSVQPPVNKDYLTDFTPAGLHAAQQWERALEVDPKVIMVTQWNEWIAQRFIWNWKDGNYGGRPIKTGDIYFVDVFSEEFNRDMEPMKGGYSDNYYYQLVANVRKFKGMGSPQSVSPAKSIAIDGQFSEWGNVSPVYQDPIGDVIHRNFPSYDPSIILTNNTGRNDIIESRVTYDDNNIYFYAKTDKPISSYTDAGWMYLLIDADTSKTTGWEGYDFIINHSVKTHFETTVKTWRNNAWIDPKPANYTVSGNEIEIAVPVLFFGKDLLKTGFYFKWADNPVDLDNISSLFINGDAAPDRRFNYWWRTP